MTKSSVFLCVGSSIRGAPERMKERRKLFGLSGSPSCPSYVCWSVVRLAAKQKKQFDGFTFRELCSLAKHDNKVGVGVAPWLLTHQMRCVERKLIKNPLMQL